MSDPYATVGWLMARKRLSRSSIGMSGHSRVISHKVSVPMRLANSCCWLSGM